MRSQGQAFPTFAGWQTFRQENEARLAARWQLRESVAVASGEAGWPGWCGLCEAPTQFMLPVGPDGMPPDLRESLACSGCGLTARQRAALRRLMDGLEPATSRICLAEQASRPYVWLQQRFPLALGGEYGLDAEKRLRLQAWFRELGGEGAIRDLDITRIDAGDASLDAIASFEVIEHLPDDRPAFAEFARCLRPGGRLVLTAPFLEHSPATVVRANRLSDGRIEHLLQAEYHGDPVDGSVLCYRHYGWDLLDGLRAAGFASAHWILDWSPREAWFGLWTLVARR